MSFQSVGQEDALEKEMATHSSILAWEILWTEEWRITVYGVTKSQTQLSTYTHALPCVRASPMPLTHPSLKIHNGYWLIKSCDREPAV